MERERGLWASAMSTAVIVLVACAREAPAPQPVAIDSAAAVRGARRASLGHRDGDARCGAVGNRGSVRVAGSQAARAVQVGRRLLVRLRGRRPSPHRTSAKSPRPQAPPVPRRRECAESIGRRALRDGAPLQVLRRSRRPCYAPRMRTSFTSSQRGRLPPPSPCGQRRRRGCHFRHWQARGSSECGHRWGLP